MKQNIFPYLCQLVIYFSGNTPKSHSPCNGRFQKLSKPCHRQLLHLNSPLQYSPYQAVTSKFYCLKQHFLLPATAQKFTKFKGTVSRHCACTAMIDSGSLLTNRNRQKRRRATMRILRDFEVFAGFSRVFENKFCLGCDLLFKE